MNYKLCSRETQMDETPTDVKKERKISWSLIAYIFLCIVIGLGIPVTLNNSGRPISAVLCLILTILIFVFFGLRWFRGTNSVFAYTGTWPPIINMCPDYLIYYKKSDGSDTCIDRLGVSKNAVLKPWNDNDTPENPPGDYAKYFPYVYKPGTSAEQIGTLCQAANQYGLTWEGIFNGESCVFTNAGPGILTKQGDTCPPAS